MIVRGKHSGHVPSAEQVQSFQSRRSDLFRRRECGVGGLHGSYNNIRKPWLEWDLERSSGHFFMGKGSPGEIIHYSCPMAP